MVKRPIQPRPRSRHSSFVSKREVARIQQLSQCDPVRQDYTGHRLQDPVVEVEEVADGEADRLPVDLAD